MPPKIVKDGDQYCLEEPDGTRVPGSCHKSKTKTRAMQIAMIMSKKQKALSIEGLDAPIEDSMIYLTRAVDGKRYIGLLSSNAYMDREGDFAALDSLKAYVDQEWPDDEYAGEGVVLFWHDGPPIADIVYKSVEGAFLVEIAEARDTPYAHAIFEGIEKTGDEIEYGASIGPWALRARDNWHVYHVVDKPETSILPVDFAANAFTHMEMTKMSEKQKKTRLTWLEDHIPSAAELAKKMSKLAVESTDQLDKVGLERKSLDTDALSELLAEIKVARALDIEGLAKSLTKMVGEVMGDKSPEDLASQIQTHVQAHVSDNDMEDEAMRASQEKKSVDEGLTSLLSLLIDELSSFGDLEEKIEKLAKLPDTLDERMKSVDTMRKALLDVNKRLGDVEGALTGETKSVKRSKRTEVDATDELVQDALAKANGKDGDGWGALYAENTQA